ncbi:hypothetical protein M885DRAFT_611064 [Pelagophyceae sp. CCMP2097]|nr:hypothetical protein M885DRAFT_611064 [Pelagophyceae sp. CCMP2097]
MDPEAPRTPPGAGDQSLLTTSQAKSVHSVHWEDEAPLDLEASRLEEPGLTDQEVPVSPVWNEAALADFFDAPDAPPAATEAEAEAARQAQLLRAIDAAREQGAALQLLADVSQAQQRLVRWEQAARGARDALAALDAAAAADDANDDANRGADGDADEDVSGAADGVDASLAALLGGGLTNARVLELCTAETASKLEAHAANLKQRLADVLKDVVRTETVLQQRIDDLEARNAPEVPEHGTGPSPRPPAAPRLRSARQPGLPRSSRPASPRLKTQAELKASALRIVHLAARDYDRNRHANWLRAFEGGGMHAALFRRQWNKAFGQFQLSAEEVGAVFETFDKDGGGTIDGAEFLVEFYRVSFKLHSDELKRDRASAKQLRLAERERRACHGRRFLEDVGVCVSRTFDTCDLESVRATLAERSAKYTDGGFRAVGRAGLAGFACNCMEPHELKEQLKAFGLSLSPRELGALFAEVDRTGCGTVDGPAFLHYFFQLGMEYREAKLRKMRRREGRANAKRAHAARLAEMQYEDFGPVDARVAWVLGTPAPTTAAGNLSSNLPSCTGRWLINESGADGFGSARSPRLATSPFVASATNY